MLLPSGYQANHAAIQTLAAVAEASEELWVIRTPFDEALAAEQRDLLGERQRLATRRLGRHPFVSRPSSLHLWITLPGVWRAEELQQHAEQEGLAITTAVPFMVEQTPPPRRIRVSLGAEPDTARLDAGLARLAGLLDEAPPPMMQIVY